MKKETIQISRIKKKVPVKTVANVGGNVLFMVLRYAMLIGISYLMVYPVLTMLSNAFSSVADYHNEAVTWLPKHPTFNNFKLTFQWFDYWKHMKVTIILSVASTAATLLVCPLVGYGLARYKFKGNGLVFACVLLTIIMPIQTAQVPLYLEYQAFDFFGIGTLIGKFTGKPFAVSIIDTPWVYILPALFGVGLRSGLFIFLFRQFFKGMPRDLEDAGKVDGCTRFGIYAKIMAPNAVPVFVTTFLLCMIFHWNDSAICSMLINNAEQTPVMLYAEKYVGELNSMIQRGHLIEDGADMTSLNALVILISGPLMALFIVCQKFFVECMDRSGIKG